MTFKKIGIIGAMDVEVDQLKAAMREGNELRITSLASMDFCEGTLGETSVVVVRCGVGMVNSAACTQILIDRFDVDAVINTGIAGSLDANIDIADIVVASDSVNHLMDVTNLGYEIGVTPGIDQLAFPANEDLRAAVLEAASNLGATTHVGRVASGDCFVCSDTEKKRITETFGAKCCEMEGAAMAQVCFLNKVPYVIIRAISDKADGSSSMDYPTFEAKAANLCANLTQKTLELL